MSKLAELIKELCPDGVEYKRVDDVCRISRGRVMSKSYIAANEGEYPVYSSQTENEGILGTICTFDYDGEYLTWTTDGANAGSVFYRNGKFSITNVCGLLDVQDDVVNTKFLYYVLVVVAPKFVNKGMGNPKLMSNVMGRISIPIPPLPVQCEIVRILDNFTALTSALTSALTAELTAQRKRYSGLLNSLLSYEGRDAQDGVLWKKLGDIVGIKRGVRVVKAQLDDTSEYPVYQNSLSPLGYYNNSNCDANKTFLITAGAAGEIGYSYIPFWAADDCYYFDCDESILIERYLYYALKTSQHRIKKMVRNASVPRLGRSSVENLLIPIPSLEGQQRIVDILDRFDKMCNDLSEGLPAEIAARQKQYEYYRDKLLTFKEKKA